MEPLSEALAVVILWVLREFIGGKFQKKRHNQDKEDLKKIVDKNSKHIEENKNLLIKIKNRIN